MGSSDPVGLGWRRRQISLQLRWIGCRTAPSSRMEKKKTQSHKLTCLCGVYKAGLLQSRLWGFSTTIVAKAAPVRTKLARVPRLLVVDMPAG